MTIEEKEGEGDVEEVHGRPPAASDLLMDGIVAESGRQAERSC